jgi:tetratricopeptide (TPR) repeat protein
VKRVALGALALVLAAAATATAGPWGKKAKPKANARAQAIKRGDYFLDQAARSVGRSGGMCVTGASTDSHGYATQAVAEYGKALGLGDDADVYYKMFISTTCMVEVRDRWLAAVQYFDGFRAADPMDPRETNILPELCTALSKLGGGGGKDADAYFVRGIAEYDLWRQRVDEDDVSNAKASGIYHTNQAELIMALGPGRIEEAIEHYARAVEIDPGESLGWYGLAVAADRNGEWGRASDAMKEAVDKDWSVGSQQRGRRLYDQGVYFVPQGDLHYYEALRAHMLGDLAAALHSYELFLSECKDTKYAGRARQHIAEIKSKGQK